MSRIGKKPIDIVKGASVSMSGRTVTVQGPKGTLTYEHRPEVKVEIEGDAVNVSLVKDIKQHRKFWGLTRSLISNMVTGVTEGYTKVLEINGVGWNAQVQGRNLKLNVGYADTRIVEIPMGVDVAVEGNKVTVSGFDKQAVGQTAAAARAHRKPEPYNHKGIKYADEILIKKEGKAFAGK